MFSKIYNIEIYVIGESYITNIRSGLTQLHIFVLYSFLCYNTINHQHDLIIFDISSPSPNIFDIPSASRYIYFILRVPVLKSNLENDF